MSEHLTPEDRDELRALAEKATPGPWHPHPRYVWTSELGGIIQNWSDDANASGDMEFIAAARTAVPALLDALAAAEHRATRAEAQSAIRGRAVAVYQQRAREAEAWARLWKETARRAIRGERVLFRVNRQAREQMGRERGHLFRVAAERSDATERAEQAEARIQAVRERLTAWVDEYGHEVYQGNGWAEGVRDAAREAHKELDGDR